MTHNLADIHADLIIWLLNLHSNAIIVDDHPLQLAGLLAIDYSPIALVAVAHFGIVRFQ